MVNAVKDWEYLRVWDKEDPAKAAFELLLESASRIGLLTPAYLTRGYDWHHLKSIFNHFSDELEYCDRAISLRSALSLELEGSGIAKVGHLIEKGFKFVLSVDNGGHWVLADRVRVDGGVFVEDPNPDDSRRTHILRLMDNWQGIALIPKEREL